LFTNTNNEDEETYTGKLINWQIKLTQLKRGNEQEADHCKEKWVELHLLDGQEYNVITYPTVLSLRSYLAI